MDLLPPLRSFVVRGDHRCRSPPPLAIAQTSRVATATRRVSCHRSRRLRVHSVLAAVTVVAVAVLAALVAVVVAAAVAHLDFGKLLLFEFYYGIGASGVRGSIRLVERLPKVIFTSKKSI